MKKIALILFLFSAASPVFPQTKFDNSIFAINEYLTSPQFYLIRLQEGELAAIDSLYVFAESYFNGDKSEALLALTFALLPFDEMKLSLPFNATLTLYLPSVGKKLFIERTESLPRAFLPDSPNNPNADTDKLSHFFGNAFLGYELNLFNIAEFLGIFVEGFEKTFKVNGAFDMRDMKINKLGFLFGKNLREDKNLLPSDFIRLYAITLIETQ